jgi:hypothetical protein
LLTCTVLDSNLGIVGTLENALGYRIPTDLVVALSATIPSGVCGYGRDGWISVWPLFGAQLEMRGLFSGRSWLTLHVHVEHQVGNPSVNASTDAGCWPLTTATSSVPNCSMALAGAALWDWRYRPA